jgi:hypothetical protein
MGILALMAISYARTDTANPIPSQEDFTAETSFHYGWFRTVNGTAVVCRIVRLCAILTHLVVTLAG